MTLDDSLNATVREFLRVRLFALVALNAVLAIACHSAYNYQNAPVGPRGIATTPVPDYPVGDAVDVYRAALDLLYTDGADRPSTIVLRDSVIPRYDHGFFGAWLTETGPTIPWKGYFCARRN
ncbi:MAG: hypothetical protein ACRENK_07200 [Gemmatimonadaceae bacterium]